jgi:alpha-methylacyl-CoA racemase
VSGVLAGVRVVILGGIGPSPFAGMVLADMGCDVIRIDRIGDELPPSMGVVARGQRSLALDLKNAETPAVLRRLIESADGVIEGFRPGVAERLGLGPQDCHAINPRLVYGRMTGWGQDGEYRDYAGHDLNYIALNGVLDALGPADGPPTFPINLIGDFGGGGMMLAFGLVCGILQARSTGTGQVVDTAMIDGSALLTAPLHGLIAAGRWPHSRGKNYLDGGAPFYNVYRTADDRYVTIASLEPQFYSRLIEALGWTGDDLPAQWDESGWPTMRARFTEAFASRSQAEWCKILEPADVCFAPVLTFAEAATHPHIAARGTFVEINGIRQPAPAPRFSATPGEIGGLCPGPGADDEAILAELGFDADAIARLRAAGSVAER